MQGGRGLLQRFVLKVHVPADRPDLFGLIKKSKERLGYLIHGIW